MANEYTRGMREADMLDMQRKLASGENPIELNKRQSDEMDAIQVKKYGIFDMFNPSYMGALESQRELAQKQGTGEEYLPSNAHSNIDTLINNNQNKDYFELMGGIMKTAENFVPPVGAIKLLQLAQRMNTAPQHESQAFFKGLKESAFGEPDPVGPQGIPFSQFMNQKKQLDPKVKSIVAEHANSLFKK